MARQTAKRRKLNPQLAAKLKEMADELRTMLYGEAGCPEWGTKFVEIERECGDVADELGRLLMAHALQEQAGRMPLEALETPEGEQALPTVPQTHRLETTRGAVEWSEPMADLRQSRKSFFPSGEGLGD